MSVKLMLLEMNDDPDQIILTSGNGVVNVLYDKPLLVFGKQISLKALYHPKFTTTSRRAYVFTVVDHTEQAHQLEIKALRYKTSRDILYSMFEAMLQLHSALQLEYPIPRLYSKSKSKSYVLDYAGSGMQITGEYNEWMGTYAPIEWSDGVFTLFDHEKVEHTTERLTAEVDLLKYDDDPECVSVYLYCNIVAPSYIDAEKKQVLAVLNLTSEHEINTIEPIHPIFHKVIFGEVMNISCYFEPVDWYDVHFDPDYSIVIVLSVK